MFQYSCELNIIKHSIFYWGLSKHLVNILIKATKCILDNILWIRSLQSFSKHSKEHSEVD